MKVTFIPSRFSRRFLRRAWERFWRLLAFHTELSVIALIGIILLIGIVKKNAIMMIDFAVEAESAGKTSGGIDLSGLPASFSANHDDDHGGVVGRIAAALWRRGRDRNCAVHLESASSAA